jgi:hypothetical protein
MTSISVVGSPHYFLIKNQIHMHPRSDGDGT